MKEYKATKDVWFIIKGEEMYADKLKDGKTLSTPNDFEIYEDQAKWEEAKKELKINDNFSIKAEEPKKPRVVRVTK